MICAKITPTKSTYPRKYLTRTISKALCFIQTKLPRFFFTTLFITRTDSETSNPHDYFKVNTFYFKYGSRINVNAFNNAKWILYSTKRQYRIAVGLSFRLNYAIMR
jgi:hypothetical protein